MRKYKINILFTINIYTIDNSGIWTDYRVTAVEDQQKFIVPLNRETEKLYYGQRIIMDAKVLTEPRVWKISKVNRLGYNGVVQVTLAQDQYNAETDFIEVKDGIVIGQWADYYPITDKPTVQEEALVAVVEYLAPRRQLRLNGAVRTFKVTYYSHDEPTTVKTSEEDWEFILMYEDEPIDALSEGLIEVEYIDNEVNVKFVGGMKYIGETLTVRNRGGECSVEITST